MHRPQLVGIPSLIACAVALACSSCTSVPVVRLESRNPLAQWAPSRNHNSRRPVIIVLHATQQGSADASLDTLRSRNIHGRVSAHYLIGRDGALYQLVAEERRAWHAGGGRWGTITDLNSASIGIELDNNGGEYPEAQVAKLLVLLEDLCERLEIPRRQVIAHADLAPARKTDPGARFPWARLAAAGFGRWPDPAWIEAPRPVDFNGWIALQLIGYRIDDPSAALRAFRLHFRGMDDGTTPMGEADLRVLYGLVAAEWGAIVAEPAPAPAKP